MRRSLLRAQNHNISNHYLPYKKKNKEQSRIEYDISLSKTYKR